MVRFAFAGRKPDKAWVKAIGQGDTGRYENVTEYFIQSQYPKRLEMAYPCSPPLQHAYDAFNNTAIRQSPSTP